MKKFKFLTHCPGCLDKHLGVTCKKPTFLVPVTVTVFCDFCESNILIRISLPKKRENKNQVSFQALKIFPSDKCVQILKERESLKQTLKTISEHKEVTQPSDPDGHVNLP